MFGFFKKRTLDDFLNETKKVKVKGLEFVIRKISPIDYLDGSKILQQSYALYQNNKASVDPMAEKKIKEFFSNVLCSAVVSPKIVYKADDPSGTHVERMFVDWEMVMKLYEEIMLFTYGKKKIEAKQLSREKLSELDFISRRYGILPSEFLKQKPGEFQFNLLVASVGSEAENKAHERALKNGKKGRS